MLNRDVNHELAKIISRSFFEIILVKKFQKQSQKLLKVKKEFNFIRDRKITNSSKKRKIYNFWTIKSK